jgi:hypothetical protein
MTNARTSDFKIVKEIQDKERQTDKLHGKALVS